VKAFTFERNGEPADVVAIRDVPVPVPGPEELLVRVRLSPVHLGDLHVIRGRFGPTARPSRKSGHRVRRRR
jgi:NADPH2:quinone reductase